MQEWPADFIDRIGNFPGTDLPAFLEGLSSLSPVSLRLNPFKQIKKFDKEKKVEWCDAGRYLPERPSFTFDPLFHAGTYYVQEASSMFLDSAFGQCFPHSDPLRVLDLCAAPGGKSTHLISLLPAGSILVSNELIPQRNKVLRQNLVQWGDPNVIITQNETKDFIPLKGYFDLVVVDAPCSGEGLFRRDPKAAKEWSVDAVNNCSIRQSKILKDAFELLRPGGVLIYSTCTFEESENEKQVEVLISRDSAELISLTALNSGLVKTEYGIRFYPHRISGEGFFISALRRTEGSEFEYKRSKPSGSPVIHQKLLESYLVDAESFAAIQKQEVIYAIPQHIIPLFHFMEKKFYIRQAGIRMGELKGSFLPAYELALSRNLRKDLPKHNFSLEDAIRYLRCDTVQCPGLEKGWTLATFENFPLGWMKVLDGRVNNYFPKEFRIIKDYNPDFI
jgi:16S rRNA C967 or C1407 C5-methylase (RsmB/RsmF family)/NOL1/NOP2/fmu family ribosome biogenesis protein